MQLLSSAFSLEEHRERKCGLFKQPRAFGKPLIHWPECSNGGETLSSLREMTEKRKLSGVIEILQISVGEKEQQQTIEFSKNVILIIIAEFNGFDADFK